MHDGSSWQTIYSFTSNHSLLLTTLSVHHQPKITHFHFTKTITKTTKRLIGHHLNSLLRISSPTDPTAQIFMRQTNTLTRQFWMLTDSLSIKENTIAQITLTYSCISASLSIIVTIFANKTNQTHKSLLLTIT